MTKLFAIRNVADPSKTATLNWQNASELVSHGHWEWADGGSGTSQFEEAKKIARVANTKPDGFDHLNEVKDTPDDDVDNEPVVSPPVPPVVPVSEIAKTIVTGDDKDPLSDMTRDELYAEATKLGLSPDKRLGTKNLLSMIREKVNEGE